MKSATSIADVGSSGGRRHSKEGSISLNWRLACAPKVSHDSPTLIESAGNRSPHEKRNATTLQPHNVLTLERWSAMPGSGGRSPVFR